jgi:nucleotide-binding universal stress UspA family protein
MIKTVIAPLDGSSTAEVTLPYVVEAAARMDSDVILLFVKEPNDYRSENLIAVYLENMAEKIKKQAEKFLPEASHYALRVQTRILTGNPADEIINFAEKQPDCYIVMATHGQSGPNTRWVLGSIADKVVRATSTPVGIIRASGNRPAVREATGIRNILAPLDGSKDSEVTLPFIKDIARLLKINVTFIHVIKVDPMITNLTALQQQEEERKEVVKYLEKKVNEFQANGISSDYVVRQVAEGVGQEINRYTEKHPVDSVIMATSGRSGAQRFIFGSVANRVMLEGNTPLILIRTPIK